jgi:hypothetical protein
MTSKRPSRMGMVIPSFLGIVFSIMLTAPLHMGMLGTMQFDYVLDSSRPGPSALAGLGWFPFVLVPVQSIHTWAAQNKPLSFAEQRNSLG